jgi:SPP1 gp7 family putative phage head morphogenesis protein
MGPPAGLFAEIARWRDKAARLGGDCTFNSDIIPEWLEREIKQAIGLVGPVDAFRFLKQAETDIDTTEARIERNVRKVLREFQAIFVAAILAGEQPDYNALSEALRAVIRPELASLTTAEALRLSAEIGIEFDPAVINAQAVEFARNYSFELVQGLTDTTRKVVQEAIATFFETPGATQEDIERAMRESLGDELEPAFSASRARAIAITETTRAAAEGTNELQRLFSADGIQMIRVWHTRNDELVCPICGPLNGQPESVWSVQFPAGPPAHPNCRCSIGLSILDAEFHLAEAVELGKMRLDMFIEDGEKELAEAARRDLRAMKERLANERRRNS